MLKFYKSKDFCKNLTRKNIDFVVSMKRMQKWRKNEKWL